jgi:hypothetical protein
MAASAYGVVAANGTPVYSDSKKSAVIGTFDANDIVIVLAGGATSGVYQIYTSASSTTTAFISYSAISGSLVGYIKSGQSVATMKPASSNATTDTSTGTSTGGSGSAGYITNCNSYVNFRKSASATSTKLGTLNKNAAVTVLGESNGFYQISSASGATGYVAKTYVAYGTPPSSGGTTSSATSGTGTIVNCNVDVNFRSKASSSSTKLGVLKKGETVTVLGKSGSFYQVKNSAGTTGYVSTKYVSITSGGGGGTAVGYSEIKVEPGKSVPNSTIKTAFDAAKSANIDTVGYIYIAGTNIKFPIMYKQDITYYDTHDQSGNTAAKGAVHSFYNVMTRNNTVTAHNMRGSNDMFHQLSHLYDKAMGKTTCQTTDYKCSASSLGSIPDLNTASNRIWNVYCFGYTQWELWAMYKTEADEPTSTINNNIQYLSNYTQSQIESWIAGQKSRSDIKLGTTVSASDIFLTVYTCGTNYDRADAQSRIYFFLKAVK